jgi:maltose alpha-D-glucosyltransferase/alpha-amylase
MQWNSGKNAGFSTGKAKDLYLPIDPAKDHPTVEAQEKDFDSLLNHVRKLAALRREHPALGGDGGFEPLYAEKNKYPFIYRRKLGPETIIVAVNPSAKPVSVDIPRKDLRSLPIEILAKGAGIKPTPAGVKLEMKGIAFGLFSFVS